MARSDLVTPSNEDTNKSESNSQLDLTWVLFSVALTLILITWAITVCICCYIRQMKKTENRQQRGLESPVTVGTSGL